MRIAGCVGGGEQDCLGAVQTWALCVQLLNDRLFEIQSFLQWLLHIIMMSSHAIYGPGNKAAIRSLYTK